MRPKLYTPEPFGYFTVQEAAEFLKDVGDKELQEKLDNACKQLAAKFPPIASFGEDAARELIAAMIVKGYL